MATSTVDDMLLQRAAQTIDLLNAKKLHVVTAESCTAGLISACLSQSEGAGEVLKGGFVVYTKDHKERALGVERGGMERDGCVTEAVVRQMAQGALKRSNADVALAVSGVLGPDPDEDGNPVGLVFFCAARRGGHEQVVRAMYGEAHHDALRHRTVLQALELIERILD